MHGHGSKSHASGEHPNPTTKIGSKMGEFTYPKWDPIGFDNHSRMFLCKSVGAAGAFCSCRRRFSGRCTRFQSVGVCVPPKTNHPGALPRTKVITMSMPCNWLWLSKPMVPFGVGAPPILVYFSGDWDVHWKYGILTIRRKQVLPQNTTEKQRKTTHEKKEEIQQCSIKEN